MHSLQRPLRCGVENLMRTNAQGYGLSFAVFQDKDMGTSEGVTSWLFLKESTSGVGSGGKKCESQKPCSRRWARRGAAEGRFWRLGWWGESHLGVEIGIELGRTISLIGRNTQAEEEGAWMSIGHKQGNRQEGKESTARLKSAVLTSGEKPRPVPGGGKECTSKKSKGKTGTEGK